MNYIKMLFQALRQMSYDFRKGKRVNDNEIAVVTMSLEREGKENDLYSVRGEVLGKSKTLFVWSLATTSILSRWNDDIIYFDATSGLVKSREKTFYVYEVHFNEP